MYVRITPASFDPAREDEVRRLVDTTVIPAIKALPGFQDYEGALDRGAGRFVNISHWDTAEHAGWSPNELGDVLSQVRSAGIQLESPQIYEVTAEA